MSKYHFSAAQRHAVWTVHKEHCWLCGDPVSMAAVCIDHIIPESLDRNKELAPILEAYALSPDFNLNHPGNWLPAHSKCNGEKIARVYEPSPLMQGRLENALEKVPEVEKVIESFNSDRGVGRSITKIAAAHELGHMSHEMYKAVLEIADAIRNEMPDFAEPTPNSADLDPDPLRELIDRQNEVQAEEDTRPTFFLAPGLEIVREDASFWYLRGRSGLVEYRPKGEWIDYSFDCPNCGPTAWNGTKCVQCGHLIDID